MPVSSAPLSSVLSEPTAPSSSAPASSLPWARAAVTGLRGSMIREVANEGMGRPDVLPFWFGESNRVTPEFIRTAAAQALSAGHTFYTHNLGIAPLRTALADYVGRLHGTTSIDNIAVTSAGVNALMLATQMLVGPGDRVVAVTPLWPNIVEMPKILGAQVECVSLDYSASGWTLDIERLIAALTPTTRMVMVNSPNNPTGWVMPREQQQRLLDHCRQHGIWILADEVYERLYYGTGGEIAPSFLDIASRDERVIAVNSFSKSWLMTGWRLGWVVAPASLMSDWSKLAEYNTSCAPHFVQHAGLAAVLQGESVSRALRLDLLVQRDHLLHALSAIPGVDVKAADGAMYLFFRIEGQSDSLALCKALVRDAGLGLAPGLAFGEEGEGFIRWCYANDTAVLDEGVRRLSSYLQR